MLLTAKGTQQLTPLQLQVNVIEETISYIDALHRRIAERFGADVPTLTQEQVKPLRVFTQLCTQPLIETKLNSQHKCKD